MASKCELETGSEEGLNSTTCTPCFLEEQVHREAEGYCPDCQEYLCSVCVRYHGKLKATKDHVIQRQHSLEARQAGKRGGTNIANNLETCEDHVGEVVKIYCRTHEAVCCGVCVSLGHKTCSDLQYIPVAVQDEKRSSHFAQLKSAVLDLRSGILQLKTDKENELRQFRRETGVLKDEIKSFEESLKQRLEYLAEVSKGVLKQRDTYVSPRLQDVVTECGRITRELDETMSVLNKTSDDVNFLKLIRKTKDDLKLHRRFYDETVLLKSLNKREFVPGTELDRLLFTMESLGEVVNLPSKDIVVDKLEKLKVRLIGESHVCHIEGSLCLPDGRLVLADTANRHLKLLDEHFSRLAMCDLPDGTDGMTVFDSENIVVCVKGRSASMLLFVSVRNGLVPGRSVQVDGKCFGVACTNGTLFVSVSDKGKKNGHIQMRDSQGNLLRTLDRDVHGQKLFGSSPPGQMTTSPAGSRVYVSGSLNNTIITVLENGSSLSSLELGEELRAPWGICTGASGMLFVACEVSNEILLVNPVAGTTKVLLSKEDGVIHPMSVSYHHVNRKLIVTMSSCDELLVFSLAGEMVKQPPQTAPKPDIWRFGETTRPDIET